MKQKRVHVVTHGPLAVYPTAEIGWEDVWLRVSSGRRTLRLAPCLVSRKHLCSDIHLTKKSVHETNEFGEHARAALIELNDMLTQIDAHGFAVDQKPKTTRRGRDPGREFAVANLYTRADWINKAEAERMIAFYLATLGLRNCVYKWKTPSFIAWPTTIAVPEEAAAA